MLSQQARQDAYTVALLDALALVLAFSVAFVVRTVYPLPFLGSASKPDLASHIWMLFLSVPIFLLLASHAGLYRPLAGESLSRLLWTCLRPVMALGLLVGTAIFLFQTKTFSRIVFFLFLFLAFAFVTVQRVLMRGWSRDGRRVRDLQRRVLIVGVNADALAVGRRLKSQSECPATLIGHVSEASENPEFAGDARVLGTIDSLKRIVEEEVVDEVIFAIPFVDLLQRRREISWCEEVGVTVHLKVDFVRTLFAKTYPTNWDGVPMLTVSSTPQDAVALLFKRLVDIVISACVLVALSPLLLLCALAIRLSSRGPLLFSQERVGLNGRLFTLYKFRSMYEDAEQRKQSLEALNEMSGPVFKIRNDPRVTPIGRRLRQFSLDEFPQLWNVLKGDMSLVGPRPPVPEEVKRYERWQRRRLSMKPGLTCLWQVNGRNRIGFEEWMKLDLAYIDNWSIKLDFIILLRTLPAVVLARGAH